MKIMIDRSVVEQALEALNASMPHNNDMDEDWPGHIAARRALRAALEQDHYEHHLNMVPTGWKLMPVEPTNEMVQAWLDTYEGNIQTVYRAMLAAAPQPPVVEQPQVEQEPVAWLHADGKHQPLYTHQQNLNCKSTQAQPPRQPLTDEEITELADAHMEAFAQFVGAGEVWFEGEKEFARAIEAAHGIGGEK